MRKKSLRWTILTVAASCLLSACQLIPKEEELPEPPVLKSYEMVDYHQIPVCRGDLVQSKTIKCQYVSANVERLSFSLSEQKVGALYVEVGQTVHAGDLLVELEMEDQKGQIHALENQMQILRVNIRYAKNDRALEQRKQDALLTDIRNRLSDLEALIQARTDWETAYAEWEAADAQWQSEYAEWEKQMEAWEAAQAQPAEADDTPEPETPPVQPETPPVQPEKPEAPPEPPTELTLDELTKQREELLEEKRTQEAAGYEAVKAYDRQIQSDEDTLYILGLQIEELRQELRPRQLYAGIDGTVTYVQKSTDDFFGLRTQKDVTFITITDRENMAFIVGGEDALLFPVGTEVTVACKDQEVLARSVEPAELGIQNPEDSGKPTAFLKLVDPTAAVEENAEGKITLILEERRNVLYLDAGAVQTAEGQPFVYVLDETGLKVMQSVTTGLECDGKIEITGGLEEGDKVIMEQEVTW